MSIWHSIFITIKTDEMKITQENFAGYKNTLK